MGGLTSNLVEKIAAIEFEHLPEPVVRKTKQILLDSIGCALGGFVTERGKIAIELVEDFGSKPEASIIGNRKAPCPVAAFANAELISTMDYDALGPLTGHVVPNVIPPSLAISERVGASGRALITAVALALEVGGRVASSVAQHKVPKEEPPYYEDAPRFSFTSVIFGAVAGACKLLHLGEEGIANALGIAGVSTPVPATLKWEHTSGPGVMLKYGCWSGWLASLGTIAALAAEKGFTGDTTILDGEWGYWKIYGSPFFKAENLIEGLGEVWHLDEVSFKAYPACNLNHTSIIAINKIIAENGIQPEEIEEILVRGDPLMLSPNRAQQEIQCQEDAQFSNAYLCALAPYYGCNPGPNWLLASTFKDPRIKNLMGKVRVTVHPMAEELIASRVKAGRLPIFFNVIVEISARGKKFTAEISAPKGSPSNPMTDQELEEKFRNNASYSMLRSEKVDKALNMIYDLDNVENVADLFKMLTM